MKQIAIAGATAETTALKEIYNNAKRAHRIANNFWRARSNAAAVHHSIICWEECSKYLIVYCKDHLPQDLFRRRFQHATKFSVGSSMYYLGGQLSVIFLLEVSGRKSEPIAGLARLLLENYKDPRHIAEQIIDVVSMKELSAEQIKRSKEDWEKTELLRRQSVYVDLDNDLNIESCPARIERSVAKKWVVNARYGIATLRFLRSSKPNLSKLISALPNETRIETQAKAKELASKIGKGRSIAGLPSGEGGSYKR
jgi:AbiV